MTSVTENKWYMDIEDGEAPGELFLTIVGPGFRIQAAGLTHQRLLDLDELLMLPMAAEFEFEVGRAAGGDWTIIHHDDLLRLQFLEPSPGERPELVTMYLTESQVLEFRLALRELVRSFGPSSETPVH